MSSLSFETKRVADCFDHALEFRNRNRPAARDAAYYRWRYLDRPCKTDAYVVWVTEGEHVLGAATVAPQDFVVAGEPCCLGLVGDISVTPESRGKGVGAALLREVRTALPSGVDDVLVLPNVEAEGALRNAGWTTLSALERRVRLLRPAEEAGLVSAAVQGGAALLSRLGHWSQRFLDARGARLDLDIEIDEWIDRLWSRYVADGLGAAVRDARFLNWRFRSHPLIRYRIAGVFRGSEPLGYVVFHTEGHWCCIDDFVLLDRRSIWLLGHAAAHAGDEVALQLRLNGSKWSAAAARAGFVKRQDQQSIMLGGKLSAASVAATNWFFTAGDKDV